MTHRHEFDAAFAQCPIIAILRGLKPSEAVSVGEALVAAGIRVLEVPLNSPQPLDSIRHLREALAGRAVVGAGTVYRESDVDDVAEAGGVLIVSPNANPAVIAHAKRLGLVSAPGVMTPTEAISALDAGADVLKLFPGEVITPAAVRAYAAVMPAGTRLVLVGGVTTANLRDYADTPLAGYGIGSALYKPGLSAAEVGERARAFLAAYAESGAKRP
jgi:2-dehydro-3-deoxyphosphogalactonate aldolase